MTELKTLRELEECSKIPCDNKYHQGGVSSEKLRAEAVKWVKFCIKERDSKAEQDLFDHCDGKIAVLEEFFNLTEEDLK